MPPLRWTLTYRCIPLVVVMSMCVYIHDLLVVMKEPKIYFQNLEKKHRYKLKGVGDPEYHLGRNLVEI